jgi:hypothetical protein
MQYLLQIYSGDAGAEFEKLSEAEQQTVMGEYFAISETPGVTGGNQLHRQRRRQPSASRTVRP